MKVFDKQIYSSLLVKGNLHEAINYLEGFPEQAELVEKYKEVFQNHQLMTRSTNKVIDAVDKIYQAYYIDVFWHKENPQKAELKLFENLWNYCCGNTEIAKDAFIELEVEKIIRNEGFEFLGGDTAGFYGPYIWATSVDETYEVELPYGVQQYALTMMDGFISRSWLDFLSFGKVGTGGWSGKDGTLCCIKSLYDTESTHFKISFLKHEAQHTLDKKLYPHITSTELEYRAKLVELIYWEDEKIITMIFHDAENSDARNTHAVASHRIISDLSKRLFNVAYVNDLGMFLTKLDDIRNAAQALLSEDAERLRNS